MSKRGVEHIKDIIQQLREEAHHDDRAALLHAAADEIEGYRNLIKKWSEWEYTIEEGEQ